MSKKARPTIKQKIALREVVENGGNIGKAMEKAGYKKATAKTPQKLTESKGWQALMEEYLPDSDLAKHHRQLLNLSSIGHMVFPSKMEDEEIKALVKENGCEVKKFQHSEFQTHVWFFMPDATAKKGGLELAYKMKGRFKEDNEQQSTKVVINIEKRNAIKEALDGI